MAIDRVPYSISLHWRYLRQDRRLTSTEISRIYRGRFSKATICRHMKQPIERQPKDNRKKNTGRPRLFDERDERRILRVAEQLRRLEGHFTIKRVKLAAGIQNVSDETVRRVFRKADLRYCHSRKKGILKRADLKARLNFALRIKRNGNQHNLWQDEIAFYLDGVGFTHKYNPFDQAQAPRTMGWRRPHDGLDFERTTKGSHEGVGGRVAHFICAIAHDKGMVLAEQYHDRLNVFHLTAIMSFSMSSEMPNRPVCLTGPLLVAKMGVSFAMVMSLAKWFLGAGRLTVCPSRRRKKSSHAIKSDPHLRSLIKMTSAWSAPIQAYLSRAGLVKTLYIRDRGSNRNVFPQLVGPVNKTFRNFPLPLLRRLVTARPNSRGLDVVVGQNLNS